MKTYHTRSFWTRSQELYSDVDEWLGSFKKDVPAAFYNYKIVGYVATEDNLIITVEVGDYREAIV